MEESVFLKLIDPFFLLKFRTYVRIWNSAFSHLARVQTRRGGEGPGNEKFTTFLRLVCQIVVTA